METTEGNEESSFYAHLSVRSLYVRLDWLTFR